MLRNDCKLVVNQDTYSLRFLVRVHLCIQKSHWSPHSCQFVVLEAYAVRRNPATVVQYVYEKTDWISFSSAVFQEKTEKMDGHEGI